jgi:hypothetical protein
MARMQAKENSPAEIPFAGNGWPQFCSASALALQRTKDGVQYSQYSTTELRQCDSIPVLRAAPAGHCGFSQLRQVPP